MIPKECKRLAEVDFPIAVVSAHAAREKSIRHGHPSTLHLWWARRPLGSCRAMLLALLLPDPCDLHCPQEFKTQARTILKELTGIPAGDANLRKALLAFIGDVANWDVANHPRWIGIAPDLVKAAHPEEPPLVVDPFAGGGSIPLEALRLGCDAFASDLNPVACLINKVLLEDIPRHGPELAEELRRVGAEVKTAAERELAGIYPADPDGSRPIAYLWARTVLCESPRCGAEIPLIRSFWLSKKSNRPRALRPVIVRREGETPYVEFEVFSPTSPGDVPAGTISGAKGTCLCCGATLHPERVRAQIVAQRGGADVLFDDQGIRVGGARLTAVVTLKEGEQGRSYRPPSSNDYLSVLNAQRRLLELGRSQQTDAIPLVPDEPINPVRPSPNARGLSAVTRYGIQTFGDLFSARQKLALLTIQRHIPRNSPETTCLAIAASRVSERLTTLARWDNSSKMETVAGTFARQALSMVWDYAEQNPFEAVGGNWQGAIEWIAQLIETSNIKRTAQLAQLDATALPLSDESSAIYFTDPPYYDAVPYADLSDFFFVWLKRVIPGHPTLVRHLDEARKLTPKIQECVWNQAYEVDGRSKDPAFYERKVAASFQEGRRILDPSAIGCIVFAHKSTEGWEALLSGLTRGGWTVTGSWPIATEMSTRANARDTASLATSVHLICRPRPESAPIGDWGDVLRELPDRVHDWMDRLETEGVHGADLVFACIGPALEVFSRYTRVESAEGAVISLEVFLQKVWEVVGRVALRRILGTDSPNVYGEDVRLTALFLWTYGTARPVAKAAVKGPANDTAEEEVTEDDPEDEGHRAARRDGYSLPYDIVRRFCQPLGIHIERWEGRLISTHQGVVTLLAVESRARQLLGGSTAQDMKVVNKPATAKEIQPLLFDDLEPDASDGKQREAEARRRYEQATYSHLHQDTIPLLDHVHKAMLFQKQGQTNALRELLFFEMSYRPEIRRLANALSALYPSDSEEKRLLDAMLLAMPK